MRKLLGLISLTVSVGCSDVDFEAGTPLPPKPSGVFKTDTFMFDDNRPKAQVDVLFVVDNSGSMEAEQQKLAQGLGSFVGSLSNIDWQIGITTTDVSAGAFGLRGGLAMFSGTNSKVLTASTPNYAQAFLNAITANGTPPGCGDLSNLNCPSGDERPLEAIRLAIGLRDTLNSGFFRNGADFATIILSDEDEASDGNATKNPTTASAVINMVKAVWGQSKIFTNYGILIQPGDIQCFQQQLANDGKYGMFADELTRLTLGVTGSICDSDYSSALSSIGQRVKKIATSVWLSELPAPGTVIVKMIPADPSITWHAAGQKVFFSDTPAKGTRVDITYDIAK